MIETLRPSLTRHLLTSLGELERALEHCPDELWEGSLWPVRTDHAFVWPIRRAGSKEPGDETLLQTVSAFWNVAYHALFYLDFYLSRGITPFKPPKPFRFDEHGANVVPRRTYTRDELLEYATHDRRKIRSIVGELTEEQAAEILPAKTNYAGLPFLDLLHVTLRHVQAHAAQLELFLGQHEAAHRGPFEQRTGMTPRQLRNLLQDRVVGRTDDEIDRWVQTSGGYAQLLQIVATGICEPLHPTEAFVVAFEGEAPLAITATAGTATPKPKLPKRRDATVTISGRDLLRFLAGEIDAQTLMIDGDADAVSRLATLLR